MAWTLLTALEATMAPQTASEVRSYLIFEISNLNYLHIHVHIIYMVWTLLTASEAQGCSATLYLQKYIEISK